MDSVNSFAEFFYNLIPGVVFLLILNLIVDLPLPTNDNSLIATIIALGLFFGFVFQGLTRLSRRCFLFREDIFEEIKSKDEPTYQRAKQILLDKNLIDKISENKETSKEIMDYFYLMDNYLRGKMQSVIIDHFAAKAAFWSNIFWGSLIIFLTSFLKIIFEYYLHSLSVFYLPIIALFALITIFLSYVTSKEYWSSQYNVVMKTFIMVCSLDCGIKIK